MDKISERGDDMVVVRYQRPRGGRVRKYDLVLDYLNGTDVYFSLFAEQQRDGRHRILRAEIDGLESGMPDDAAEDFARLWWYVFPSRERGRKLLPVVALWDVGGVTVAACLPGHYGAASLPLERQELWFSGDSAAPLPDPERLLCWWPDPVTWGAVDASAAELRKLVPAGEAALSFYTYPQWRQRPDVMRMVDEMVDEAEREGYPAEDVVAGILADEYALYLRRVRTSLCYYRKHGLGVRVTQGDAAYLRELFREGRLDPDSAAALAEASTHFPEMPEFVIEERGTCGPVGVVAGASRPRAAVSFVSYWPDAPSVPDLIAARVYAGSCHLVDLLCWLNPLYSCDHAAQDRAVGALWAELERRGVDEIAVVGGPVPFEICSHCGELAFRVPESWSRPAHAAGEKKPGRNDPCPCGSGLKYRKCCGRVS